MNARAKPWLPANAIGDNTVTALVVEHATRWASRWFRDPKAISATTSTILRPTKVLSTATCWATGGSELLLAVDELSLTKTASLVLGVPQAPKLNAADMYLVRVLAGKCLQDLLGGLAQCFAAPDPRLQAAPQPQVEDAMKFSLAFAAGGPALDIYVDRALVVAARRSAAKGARSGPALTARSAAIGRQTIRIGASLGGATLTLPELSALSCGDVLVLDRTCTDELTLTLNDELFPAACVLQRADTTLELRMTRTGASTS